MVLAAFFISWMLLLLSVAMVMQLLRVVAGAVLVSESGDCELQ